MAARDAAIEVAFSYVAVAAADAAIACKKSLSASADIVRQHITWDMIEEAL